ncbi:hypothetical protein [Dryocola clanedunensis]
MNRLIIVIIACVAINGCDDSNHIADGAKYQTSANGLTTFKYAGHNLVEHNVETNGREETLVYIPTSNPNVYLSPASILNKECSLIDVSNPDVIREYVDFGFDTEKDWHCSLDVNKKDNGYPNLIYRIE